MSDFAPDHALGKYLDRVTVVIVSYNSAHCLPDLAAFLQDLPHITLVDNGSSDGSAELMKELLPQVKVIALSENLGFGVANNMALGQVATPYAMLLNPDCMAKPESLAALVQAADESWPQAACLAPQLLGSNGKAQINYSWPRHMWRPKAVAASGVLGVGYACAAAWLLNMQVMRDLGFFDPRIFLYYEDEDLCMRMFAAQKDILIVPQIQFTHAARGSVRGKHPYRAEYLRGYHHIQSKLYFNEKHFAKAPQKTKRIVQATLLLLLRTVLFSPKHLSRAFGRWRGVLEYQAAQPH